MEYRKKNQTFVKEIVHWVTFPLMYVFSQKTEGVSSNVDIVFIADLDKDGAVIKSQCTLAESCLFVKY